MGVRRWNKHGYCCYGAREWLFPFPIRLAGLLLLGRDSIVFPYVGKCPIGELWIKPIYRMLPVPALRTAVLGPGVS